MTLPPMNWPPSRGPDPNSPIIDVIPHVEHVDIYQTELANCDRSSLVVFPIKRLIF